MEGSCPPWTGRNRFPEQCVNNFQYMNPLASRGMNGDFGMVGRFPLGMDQRFYGNMSYPGNMQDIRQQFLIHGSNGQHRPDMRFAAQPGNNGYPKPNNAAKLHNNGWNGAPGQQPALYDTFGPAFPGNHSPPSLNRGPFPEKDLNQVPFTGKNVNDPSYLPTQSKSGSFSNDRDMQMASGQKYPSSNQTLISPQKDNSDFQRSNQITDFPDRSRKRQKNKQSSTDTVSDPVDTDNSNSGKKCGVCGEPARSMHFGGMACDSCKAFFRRSVQSGVWKNFKCPEEQKCPVSKGNRKGCQFCRFQKCKTNGMEVNWVMSESDRMQMWKNRLAKQRQITTDKEKEVEFDGLPPTLNPDVAENIKLLTKLQEDTFSSLPYPEECWGGTVESLANTFVCICQKLGTFFSKVEDFKQLSKNDQRVLLNSGIGMSIYLHGAHMYDEKNKCWPSELCKDAFSVPPVSMELLREMSALPEAYNSIMKFYNKYHHELKDEVILVLLSLISFYQSDSPNFEDPKAVQDTQEKYLEHLQHYLKCKDGDPASNKLLFPKLLVGLADVREIVEFHNKIDIKPSINHIEKQQNEDGSDALTSVNHKKKQQLNEYKNAVGALTQLFLESNKGEYSQFSSILSPKEKQKQYWRGKNNSTLKQECSTKGKDLSHPYTSIMYGTNIQTDLLLSNPLIEFERCLKEDKIDLRRRPRLSIAQDLTKTKISEQKAVEAPKNDDIAIIEEIPKSVTKTPPVTAQSNKCIPEHIDSRVSVPTSHSRDRESNNSEYYGIEAYLSQAYSPVPYSPPQSSQIHYHSQSGPIPDSYSHHKYGRREQELSSPGSNVQKNYSYQGNYYDSPVDSPGSYTSSNSYPSNYSHSTPGEYSQIVSRDFIHPSTSEHISPSPSEYSPSTSREYSPALSTEYSPLASNSYGSRNNSNNRVQFGGKEESDLISAGANLQVGMEKKKAVEVLCEVLQQISCSDDQEIIASLKESLPPDVLLKVAEKLNS